MDTYYSNIIGHALREGRTVELEHADESGLQLVVDGVPLLDTDHGFAIESFDYPVYSEDLTEDAEPLVREVREAREEFFEQRRIERLTRETVVREGRSRPAIPTRPTPE